MFDDLSPNQLRLLKAACETDFITFCRVFFRLYEGNKLKIAPHHKVLAQVLHAVRDGRIMRLIVNEPPGYTKTMFVSVLFTAWCMASVGGCKFIHTSASDDLALGNSQIVREIINLPLYQQLWGIQIKKDLDAKKAWFATDGSGMLARAAKGQITGFRAGYMREGFSGALVVDDPIKPEDSVSDTLRTKVNLRFNNTLRSRLALETVPIIIIMQRVHDDDLTGFLLRGGSGDRWHYLCIPAEGADKPVELPRDYTHVMPITYSLPPGPIWPEKHDQAALDTLKKDKYTYSAQYLQRPTVGDGGLFLLRYWRYFDQYSSGDNVLHNAGNTVALSYKIITADTAMKTKEHNDYSVLQCWGKGVDGKAYALDQWRGKWEAPDLRSRFFDFCAKHDFKDKVNAIGVRGRYVEDKASGTGLVQDMLRIKGTGWVEGVQCNADKISRYKGILPQIESGNVLLPRGAAWVEDFELELAAITPSMSHSHDDQADAAEIAIKKLLIDDTYTPYAEVL